VSVLDSIQKFGKGGGPRRTLIYGEAAVGKTTWASRWPKPVLVPLEDGYRHVNVDSFPSVFKTAMEAYEACREIIRSTDYQTIIIDSIDWFEVLCQADIDSEGIDQGWGRGNKELARRVHGLLKCLDVAKQNGKHVVLIGHQMTETIERPDGLTYQTHNVKLSPKSRELVVEWCDEVVYASRDYAVRGAKDGKPGVGVDKGTRVLHTDQTPAFVAKNRTDGLPAKFDLNDFDSYFSFVSK